MQKLPVFVKMILKASVLFLVAGFCAALPDLEELVQNVEKNFKYLDQQEKLDLNATFVLAWGVGELYIVQNTVPDMVAADLKEIKALIPKYDVFIQKALDENPDALDVQLLYHPDRWGLSGDYRFKKGRIPVGAALDVSLQEIYERSVPTTIDMQCAADLINTNKGSDTPRVCTVGCKDIMRDTNFTEGIAVDERITYITFEALLNCSNETPPQRLEIVNEFCNFTKQQVSTMYERRYEAEFDAIKYFFLNKMLLCGTYGFPEFYSDEYVSEIISSINSDGSVGTKNNSLEEKAVLTSQVAAILASVIRLVEENKHC